MFTMDRLTTAPSSGPEMDPWDPPLKAKKPNSRMKPPRAANWSPSGAAARGGGGEDGRGQGQREREYSVSVLRSDRLELKLSKRMY